MGTSHQQPDVEPARNATLLEQAYQQLRNDILRGHLAPDTKLKMEDLQQRTGLSSSPLREALNRLSMEGLVDAPERRGFRVASISLADFRDITMLRLMLEKAAIRRCLQSGDDAWEAALVAAFHRLEIVERRVDDGRAPLNDEWSARHRDFHMALLGQCQSPRMLTQIGTLFDQSERYRRLSATHRIQPRNEKSEHQSLMELALARNLERIHELLEKHICETATDVERVLGPMTTR